MVRPTAEGYLKRVAGIYGRCKCCSGIDLGESRDITAADCEDRVRPCVRWEEQTDIEWSRVTGTTVQIAGTIEGENIAMTQVALHSARCIYKGNRQCIGELVRPRSRSTAPYSGRRLTCWKLRNHIPAAALEICMPLDINWINQIVSNLRSRRREDADGSLVRTAAHQLTTSV